VQGEVERALSTVARRGVEVVCAGRTDAGVHAWGQVLSHRGEAVRARSLNGVLPPDVAVLASEAAPEGFDARRDAVSRTYCYRLLARAERSAFEARRALWWPRALDRDALHACAAALPGRHDLTAFTPTDTAHVLFERNITVARWEEHGDLLEFWIEAPSFMRHMNRVLVGTMLEAASGARPLSSFVSLLSGAPRSAAGPTAPPHGLALASVAY
jgi:tRNA pseudouridine38-40 synthase